MEPQEIIVYLENLCSWNITQEKMRLEIIKLLKELQYRRESDLKPCAKFFTNSPDKQIMHVVSEIKEIQKCLQDLHYPKMNTNFEEVQQDLAMEIEDAKTALVTLSVICGFSKEDMIRARKKVIAKNADRGYYQEVKP